jgi:hypothetical protein
MLRLPSLGDMDRGMASRICLCTSPTDMRKGFDTLAALVKGQPSSSLVIGGAVVLVGGVALAVAGSRSRGRATA